MFMVYKTINRKDFNQFQANLRPNHKISKKIILKKCKKLKNSEVL